MKIKLFSFITLAFAMSALTACNFELNEHLEDAYLMTEDATYNEELETTRRAFLTIMVKGLNEEDYTLVYTIDGNPGVGEYAMHMPDQAKAQWTYNSQNFTGDEMTGWEEQVYPRLEENLFSGNFTGNFPSGSSCKLKWLNDGANKHPQHGSVFLLSPKLKPGEHTIAFTITNSYGESCSNEAKFTIKKSTKKN